MFVAAHIPNIQPTSGYYVAGYVALVVPTAEFLERRPAAASASETGRAIHHSGEMRRLLHVVIIVAAAAHNLPVADPSR